MSRDIKYIGLACIMHEALRRLRVAMESRR